MSDEFGVIPQDIRDAAFGLEIPAGETVDKTLAALIRKAAVRVRAVPGVGRRVDAGELDVAVVRGVVEDMVLRVVKNPRSVRSFGVDDFQTTIDNAVSTGALYVSADERGLLTAPPAGSRRGVGSIRLSLPGWRVPGA